MKTIEERAKEFAYKWGIEEYQKCGYKPVPLPTRFIKDIDNRLERSFLAGYKEATADNEPLLCEIDNLHNLTFWLRLQNHELIIGEF